jgi:hypothetical protein
VHAHTRLVQLEPAPTSGAASPPPTQVRPPSHPSWGPTYQQRHVCVLPLKVGHELGRVGAIGDCGDSDGFVNAPQNLLGCGGGRHGRLQRRSSSPSPTPGAPGRTGPVEAGWAPRRAHIVEQDRLGHAHIIEDEELGGAAARWGPRKAEGPAPARGVRAKAVVHAHAGRGHLRDDGVVQPPRVKPAAAVGGGAAPRRGQS